MSVAIQYYLIINLLLNNIVAKNNNIHCELEKLHILQSCKSTHRVMIFPSQRSISRLIRRRMYVFLINIS